MPPQTAFAINMPPIAARRLLFSLLAPVCGNGAALDLVSLRQRLGLFVMLSLLADLNMTASRLAFTRLVWRRDSYYRFHRDSLFIIPSIDISGRLLCYRKEFGCVPTDFFKRIAKKLSFYLQYHKFHQLILWNIVLLLSC